MHRGDPKNRRQAIPPDVGLLFDAIVGHDELGVGPSGLTPGTDERARRRIIMIYGKMIRTMMRILFVLRRTHHVV